MLWLLNHYLHNTKILLPWYVYCNKRFWIDNDDNSKKKMENDWGELKTVHPKISSSMALSRDRFIFRAYLITQLHGDAI